MGADAYLRALRAELVDLPPERREAAVDDVRALLDDAVAEGRPVERVLAELGPVARYRAELGLTPRDESAARRAALVLQLAAVVTTLFGAFFALTWTALTSVPWQAGTGQQQAVDLPDTLYSDLAVAVLPTALVVLTTAVSLVVARSGSTRTVAGWRAVDLTALAGGLAVAGASAVDLGGSGWIAVPSALLLIASGVLPRRLRRTGAATSSTRRRWVRAAAVALPGGLVLGAVLAQGHPSGAGGLWYDVAGLAMPIGMLAAAALVGLGSRPAHAAVVAVGTWAMASGLVEGSMLVLAAWWLGGLWVLTGLTGLLDGTRWALGRRTHLTRAGAVARAGDVVA